MPRNGSGVMSWPANTAAIPNTTIESSKYNAFLADLLADLNAPRPITTGGTGATTPAGARTALQITRANLGATTSVLTKTAGYTAVLADRGALIRFTTAATLALTAAATLTADWYIDVAAVGVDVVVDPNGAELIDGASTLTISAGSWATIYCDGTGFYSALTKAASEAAKGLIQIATAAQIAALSSNLMALTPGRLKDSLAWFTITYAASIPIAHTNGKNQQVTLAGNGAFLAPTGGIPGETLDIAVIQDGTGNRVPTWNSAFDFGDYGTPVLSTGAGQEDILGFKCRSSGKFAFYGIRRRTD